MDDDDFEGIGDYEGPSSYKGFDLSDIDYRDLPDLMEKIDELHTNLRTIKELCERLVSAYEPIRWSMKRYEVMAEPDIHQSIMEEAIKIYGKEKGREIIENILGKLGHEPIELQLAKAKAFVIAYERQFEDEDAEPIPPSQFQNSDVYRSMQKLTGSENPLLGLI